MRYVWIFAAAALAACRPGVVQEERLPDQPDIEVLVADRFDDQLARLPSADIRQKAAANHLRARQLYLAMLGGAIRKDGFDRDYVINTTLESLAQRRASTIGTILGMDLNGDGDVSLQEREIRLAGAGQRGVRTDRLQTSAIDVNNDGVLSAREVLAFANRNLLERQEVWHREIDRHVEMFAFDFDEDGIVTVDEVTGFLNNSPTVDSQESEASRCGLPRPSEDAEIIALSVYGTNTLSSVAIGDEDNEVDYSRLYVEPGERPIYLVAASYEAMIWEFDGAVDRIEHFAVASSHASGNAVGVIGLTEDQVALQTDNKCVKRLKGGDEVRDAHAKLPIADVLGRPADRIVGNHRTEILSLPSGEATHRGQPYMRVFGERPETVARATWESFTRFNAGGVARLDPAKVIATHPALSYSVMPQEAGLVQLEHEGKIKRVGGSLVGGTYVLLKPIGRWPAGLAGAHSVQFIVPRHIPVPIGDSGHSGVYAEATGSCKNAHGGLCGQAANGAFETLLDDLAREARAN